MNDLSNLEEEMGIEWVNVIRKPIPGSPGRYSFEIDSNLMIDAQLSLLTQAIHWACFHALGIASMMDLVDEEDEDSDE